MCACDRVDISIKTTSVILELYFDHGDRRRPLENDWALQGDCSRRASGRFALEVSDVFNGEVGIMLFPSVPDAMRPCSKFRIRGHSEITVQPPSILPAGNRLLGVGLSFPWYKLPVTVQRVQHATTIPRNSLLLDGLLADYAPFMKSLGSAGVLL